MLEVDSPAPVQSEHLSGARVAVGGGHVESPSLEGHRVAATAFLPRPVDREAALPRRGSPSAAGVRDRRIGCLGVERRDDGPKIVCRDVSDGLAPNELTQMVLPAAPVVPQRLHLPGARWCSCSSRLRSQLAAAVVRSAPRQREARCVAPSTSTGQMQDAPLTFRKPRSQKQYLPQSPRSTYILRSNATETRKRKAS